MSPEEKSSITAYRSRIKIVCFCVSIFILYTNYQYLFGLFGMNEFAKEWDLIGLVIGALLLLFSVFISHAAALVMMLGLPKADSKEEFW